MRVFAISDLHLSGADPKPMEIFGEHWQNYFENIENAWRQSISVEDIVLIAGDISCAMRLEDAAVDLMRINALPGRKVLLRGNHDYWWGALTKVRSIAGDMHVIQNDAVRIDGAVFCGSRGWLMPGSKDFSAADRKIFNRELLRLEMSLKCAAKLAENGEPIVVLTHFPPFDGEEGSMVTELISAYGAKAVVYGHIHGREVVRNNPRRFDGTDYYITSCDLLGFSPIEIKID